MCNAPGPSRFFGDLKRPKEMLLTVPEHAEYHRIHFKQVYRLLRVARFQASRSGAIGDSASRKSTAGVQR